MVFLLSILLSLVLVCPQHLVAASMCNTCLVEGDGKDFSVMAVEAGSCGGVWPAEPAVTQVCCCRGDDGGVPDDIPCQCSDCPAPCCGAAPVLPIVLPGSRAVCSMAAHAPERVVIIASPHGDAHLMRLKRPPRFTV